MAVENHWPTEFDQFSDLWLLQKPMIKTTFLLRITMKEIMGGYVPNKHLDQDTMSLKWYFAAFFPDASALLDRGKVGMVTGVK